MAERREAFEALEQENERLAAALREANTARADLESASKRAQSRIAELTKATEVAVRDSGRIDKELADLRRQNADLAERLALADSARGAVETELTQTRSEMQQKLEAATGAAEQSSSALAQLREQLARAGQELARAQSAREQARRAGERAGALQGEAERVRAELAAVKEQLSQAASPALEAERGRQTTSAEAEQLRGELARARRSGRGKIRGRAGAPDRERRGGTAAGRVGAARQKELAAAKSEAERGARRSASAEAERLRGELGRTQKSWPRQNPRSSASAPLTPRSRSRVNSLRADSQSAMEAARRNLVVMEERIEQLNTALAGAGMGQRAPASQQASPIAKPDEEASPIGRRPRPARQRKAAAPLRAPRMHEAAAARPATASSPKESSELAKFNANIAYLNRRAWMRRARICSPASKRRAMAW